MEDDLESPLLGYEQDMQDTFNQGFAPEDGEDVAFAEEDEEIKTPIKWNKEAASERGGQVAIVAGDVESDLSAIIAEELQKDGTSPTADAILDNTVKENEVIKVVVGSQLEDKEVAPEVVHIALQEELDIPDEVVTRLVAAFNPEGKDPEETFRREANLRATIDERWLEASQFEGGFWDNTADFLGNVFPWLENLATMRFTSKLEDKFDVDFGPEVFALVAGGEYLKKVRDWLDEMGDDERWAVTEGVIAAAEEASGLFGTNDFTKLQILENVNATRAGTHAEGISTDWARIIPNLVGVIDVIGVAGLVLKLGKGGKAAYAGAISAKSVSKTVDRISRPAGARLSAQIIDGVPELAQRAGTTKEAVTIDKLLPGFDRAVPKSNIPESAVYTARAENDAIVSGYAGKNLDDLQSQAAGLEKYEDINLSRFMSEEEKLLQISARNKSIADVQGVHLAGNNSVQTRTETGVDTIAAFFRSSSEAFKASTLKEGVATLANKFPGRQIDVVEVLYGGKRVNRGPLKPDWTIDPPKNKPPVDPVTGENFTTVRAVSEALEDAKVDLDKLTGVADKKKANAQIKEYEDYLKSDSAKQQAIADDGSEYVLEVTFKDAWSKDTTEGFNIEDIVGSGTNAVNLLDISAGLPRNISDGLYVAADLDKASVKRMMTLLSYFVKAKNSNQKLINALLVRGDRESEVYTASQIINGLPSSMSAKDINEVVDGYIAVRLFSNASFTALNKMHRAKAVADGLLSIDSGGIKILGKPLSDDVGKQLKVAWDPAGGENGGGALVSITDDILEGSSFYRSQQLHGNMPNNKTYNIIVRNDSGIKVGDLPDQLLTHRKGHLGRMHEDLYILKKTPKEMMVDGVKVAPDSIPSAAVRTATSKKSGTALRDQLRNEDPDHNYELVYDRNLTTQESRDASFEVEYNNNGMYFGKRGERLRNETMEEADIVDPVGSIARMASAVSHKINVEPVIALNKARWSAMFDQFLPPASRGKFPLRAEEIGVAGNIIGKEKEIGKAKAYWAHITQQETNGVISDRWRMWTIRAGEYLEGVGWAEKAGIPTWLKTKAGTRDPMSILRGAAFTSMITLNPARQLFLQSQQFLLLSGLDPVHVLSGATTRQAMPLMMAVMSRSPKRNKALAKAAGIEHSEFESMVKGLKDSGMFDAVDEHLIGREALLRVQGEITNTVGGAARQYTANAIKSTLNGIKAAGFDMGELTNLAHTYVIARRRFAKANPGVDLKSKDALQQIHADSRQLALGMSAPGGFAYQKGWFSLGLQFFSVQHKAALFMLPAFGYLPGKLGRAAIKYGNSSVSRGEAAKIATLQLGLFGFTGLGLQVLYDKFVKESGVDISADAHAVLKGGLYDLAFNAILSNIHGEDVDLAVGDSIAAGSGYQETILRTIADLGGEKDLMEIVFGPSMTTISKTKDAVNQLRTVLGVTFGGGELPEGEVELTFDKFARIASGYNNYVKARAATASGHWVAKGDSPTDVSTTATEQKYAALFGLPGAKVKGLYDHFSDTKKHSIMIEETAEKYYERVTLKYTELLTLPQDQYSTELTIKALGQEAEFLRRAFSGEPEDFDLIMHKVGDLIKQRADFGEGALANKMARAAMKGGYGSSFQEFINSMVRSKLITQEEADLLIPLNTSIFGDNK